MAQTDKESSSVPWPDLKIETLVEGLQYPSAVAIQPGTNQVFVSESGAGRIVKLVDGQAQPVVTDFPTERLNDSDIVLGPLGLIFLDPTTLVVGEGGQASGVDRVLVFKLDDPNKVLTVQDAKSAFALPAKDQLVGEGNFSSVGLLNNNVYVSCRGDDEKSWIARAERSEPGIANLRRQIATRESGTVGTPLALATSPEGFLVAALAGKFDQLGDAEIAFFDDSGVNKARFATGLNDVVGLAYGPKLSRMFVVDFAWADAQKGGLFQLLESNEPARCVAREVMKLDRPTSIAFDGQGAAYVAILGPANSGGQPTGKILKIVGLDDTKNPGK